MQNRQAIGIFDSGIGGLSVLKDIRQLMPNEALIYIADSRFAPYGNKPLEFIQQRSHALVQFLVEQNCKAIVVACNTATAAAIHSLRRQFEIPIIAMEPGVKPAIAATHSGVVGVLATENTLSSEQFTRLLHRYAEDVKVISQPCPGLVEQIEAGEFDSDATRQLIRQFTRPLLTAGADTIVLGCTHYPLIRPQIEAAIAALTAETNPVTRISIIETGHAVAQQLKRVLLDRLIVSNLTEEASISYLTSGEQQPLEQLCGKILGQTIKLSRLPAL